MQSTSTSCQQHPPWLWQYHGLSFDGSCVLFVVYGMVSRFSSNRATRRAYDQNQPTTKINHWPTYTNQSVFGLKFLGSIQTVVDQSESSGFTATKSSAESKDKDVFNIAVVHFSELFSDFLLGYIGTIWVQHIDNLHTRASEFGVFPGVLNLCLPSVYVAANGLSRIYGCE